MSSIELICVKFELFLLLIVKNLERSNNFNTISHNLHGVSLEMRYFENSCI
jgi:hypothetical protein